MCVCVWAFWSGKVTLCYLNCWHFYHILHTWLFWNTSTTHYQLPNAFASHIPCISRHTHMLSHAHMHIHTHIWLMLHQPSPHTHTQGWGWGERGGDGTVVSQWKSYSRWLRLWPRYSMAHCISNGPFWSLPLSVSSARLLPHASNTKTQHSANTASKVCWALLMTVTAIVDVEVPLQKKRATWILE